MELPLEVRERFRAYGKLGGETRAATMNPQRRAAVARRAATARWIRERFGESTFAALGLPGGDIIDTGLADLAEGKTSIESLAVSLAAPRLAREGVPLGPTDSDPESRLYEMLYGIAGDLAHHRYRAYLGRLVSFADACRQARIDHQRRAS